MAYWVTWPDHSGLDDIDSVTEETKDWCRQCAWRTTVMLDANGEDPTASSVSGVAPRTCMAACTGILRFERRRQSHTAWSLGGNYMSSCRFPAACTHADAASKACGVPLLHLTQDSQSKAVDVPPLFRLAKAGEVVVWLACRMNPSRSSRWARTDVFVLGSATRLLRFHS